MATYDLDLGPSPRTTLFRMIDNLLRNDPVLKRVIKGPHSFRSWRGEDCDRKPFGVEHAPALRLTKSNGPEAFWNPSSMAGQLIIDVEMVVKGVNTDNVDNLWWAVTRAIYPKGAVATNVPAFQAAGARSGVATFPQPAYDPDPDGDFLKAVGRIVMDVNLPLA